MSVPPRLAVRAVIVENGRLLLVNAYAEQESALWCAPGGGVERGASLPDNLIREVHEETGLRIAVGDLVLVNEFHDAETGFHQVDLFFRARIVDGRLDPSWTDPEAVVTRRGFFDKEAVRKLKIKPGALMEVAFADTPAARYDPLEPMVF